MRGKKLKNLHVKLVIGKYLGKRLEDETFMAYKHSFTLSGRIF